jgi:large conductance mechanosensitive channel
VNGSVIAWGAFVTALVVFILTALAVFLFIVKPYNALEARLKSDDGEETAGPTEVELLADIRDQLARRP